MKLSHCLLPILVASLWSGAELRSEDCPVNCDVRCERDDESQYEQNLNEKDWDALYDYINTKRTINVKEKASNLTISGDVRANWRHRCETRRHQVARGDGASNALIITDDSGHPLGTNQLINYEQGLPIGRNDFDIALNLRLDYVCDRAWGVAHLEFDNCAGVCNSHNCERDRHGLHGSGSGCDLDLKKAYMGYNLYCDGCSRFDLELGRRRLYQVFNSEVQFLSRFDGILFKYSRTLDSYADWYLNVAGFVVDNRVNHYAWVGETGFENIMDSGFDLSYSFIDWRKRGENRCRVRDPEGAKFEVSQLTLYYNFEAPYLCVPSRLFMAGLCNHAAEKKAISVDLFDTTFDFPKTNKKANLGWYAGFNLGEVVSEGDWAFSGQYQWVEAKAIPDDDVSGIGRGNCHKESFWATGRGNTNFKGWRFQALYAFTDNISLEARVEWSRAIDKDFGGNQKYSQFRLDGIYAF